MYENKSQGLQKAAHERMLNNQGRKIIKENVKGNIRNFDNYKNMSSGEGPGFDQKWDEMAARMNFKSSFGNALEYGDRQYQAPPRNHQRAEARGLGIPEGMTINNDGYALGG